MIKILQAEGPGHLHCSGFPSGTLYDFVRGEDGRLFCFVEEADAEHFSGRQGFYADGKAVDAAKARKIMAETAAKNIPFRAPDTDPEPPDETPDPPVDGDGAGS